MDSQQVPGRPEEQVTHFFGLFWKGKHEVDYNLVSGQEDLQLCSSGEA